MKKILIPIDSDNICPKALEMAKDLGNKYDSEVCILHVIQDFKRGISPYTLDHAKAPEFHEMHLKTAKEMVHKVAEMFSQDGITVTEEVLSGNAAHAICEYAENNNFDMIIMCSHGYGTVKRFLLGSVSSKVVHHVTIPVLIVR